MKNGYVYHTARDNTDNIQVGAVLRCGENVLGVARALAALNPANLTKDRTEETLVYFELLGSMVVSYPIWVGKIINLATCVLCVFIIFINLVCFSKKSDLALCSLFWRLFLIFCGRIGFVLIGVIWAYGTAKILEIANCTMPWFDSLHLIFILYVMPVIVADIAVSKLVEYLLSCCKLIEKQISVLIFMSVHLLFVVLTMMGTFASIFPASSFLPMFFVFFPLFATMFLKNADTIVTALFTAFPIAYCSYIVVIVIPFFAAIQGRKGTSENPDLYIGIGSSVFAIVILSYSSAKIPKDKWAPFLAVILLLTYAIVLVAVVFTPLGFPYTAQHQMKRYKVLHIDETVLRNEKQVSHSQGITVEDEDFRWVNLSGIVPGFDNDNKRCYDSTFLLY